MNEYGDVQMYKYIYFKDDQSAKSRLAGFHKETSYMYIYKYKKLYNGVIINIYIYRYDDCTFIQEFTVWITVLHLGSL